jgi:biopolymer transport protein ExbD
MSSILPPRRKRYWINIVPLIDVLTILIFFFLITMHFRPVAALKITPPKIDTASPTEKNLEFVRVGVSSTGEYFLDRQVISLDNLNTALVNRAKAYPKPSVIIEADENTSLKYATALMDSCQKAGLTQIQLESR